MNYESATAQKNVREQKQVEMRIRFFINARLNRKNDLHNS